MVPADSTAMPAFSPGVRMASWSFYLGLVGFLAVVISAALRIIPFAASLLLFGGVALGVIAVVLGIVGLASINRAGALAGLLFGALTIAVFAFYVFYLRIGGLGV